MEFTGLRCRKIDDNDSSVLARIRFRLYAMVAVGLVDVRPVCFSNPQVDPVVFHSLKLSQRGMIQEAYCGPGAYSVSQLTRGTAGRVLILA